MIAFCKSHVAKPLEIASMVSSIETILKDVQQYLIHPDPNKKLTLDDNVRYDNDILIATYNKLTECKHVKKIVKKFKLLKNYTDLINNKDPLIFTQVHSFNPFCIDPHSGTIDFALLYAKDVSSSATGTATIFLLEILKKILDISARIYTNVTSPNMSQDVFFDMIDGMCDKVGKELRGVEQALKYLRNSKDVLKKNFSSYYLNFKITKNPAVFIDQYIEGIKEDKGIKEDDKVSRQFKKLVQHYKNKMAKANGLLGAKELGKFGKLVDVSNDLVDVCLGGGDDSDNSDSDEDKDKNKNNINDETKKEEE
jgi:hypothetical protein